jgi:hypothetical protein
VAGVICLLSLRPSMATLNSRRRGAHCLRLRGRHGVYRSTRIVGIEPPLLIVSTVRPATIVARAGKGAYEEPSAHLFDFRIYSPASTLSGTTRRQQPGSQELTHNPETSGSGPKSSVGEGRCAKAGQFVVPGR